MIIAIDWDGTIVSMAGRSYDDVTSPMRFMPKARDGLAALKRAGHTLVLFSARTNRALCDNPHIDPLVRAGVRKVDMKTWPARRRINWARRQQMFDFVERELPGVFDAIDDGMVGKVTADLFIDDRCIKFGGGYQALDWEQIAYAYGEPAPRQKKNGGKR